MNKKNAFRRGFTLIELMIVIVILGILMGTILPRLTGAQARARDTARKADLTNLSQALEVFYGDTGQYPAADTPPCLDPKGTGNTAKKLGEYMKGGKVPPAVSASQVTLSACTGTYYYKPLKVGGITKSSYILASDVETYQLANYVAPTVSANIFDSNQNASTYIGNIKGPNQISKEADSPQRTIYIVIP